MKENCPSETALKVALRRAAHQILDNPKVFDDPLALKVLGTDEKAALNENPKWLERSPFLDVLRAALAARSRWAEDELHLAANGGVRQYVILGAGLDTFAYRNPYENEGLRVFEVDHPATQEWKRSQLAETGIPVPETLTFTPIDFQEQSLDEGLRRAGLDMTQPAFFSWLGVTPYLTEDAIFTTLKFVAAMPTGSRVAFDYMIPPSQLPPMSRRAFDVLSQIVARAGEPFQTFCDTESLKNDMLNTGFSRTDVVTPDEMDERYFKGRDDNLRAGRSAHMMCAGV